MGLYGRRLTGMRLAVALAVGLVGPAATAVRPGTGPVPLLVVRPGRLRAGAVRLATLQFADVLSVRPTIALRLADVLLPSRMALAAILLPVRPFDLPGRSNAIGNAKQPATTLASPGV
jgi:hypothetical protein